MLSAIKANSEVQKLENFINSIHHKDELNFILFFDEFAPVLYGYITKHIQSKDIAEKILCRSFSKAWKNKNEFKSSESTLLTWLLKICIAELICLPK